MFVLWTFDGFAQYKSRRSLSPGVTIQGVSLSRLNTLSVRLRASFIRMRSLSAILHRSGVFKPRYAFTIDPHTSRSSPVCHRAREIFSIEQCVLGMVVYSLGISRCQLFLRCSDARKIVEYVS